MNNCSNCGLYFRICNCTWDEQLEAKRILHRKAAESRRKSGNETVVEKEQQEQRKLIKFNLH